MAGTTLQEILASRNLIGRVVDIVNGVPEDILPAGFLTANRTTEGDRGEYLRVAGTRQTSTMSRYGAPAKHVAPVGIGSTPVKLIHTFEDFTHDPTILNLLIEETGTGLIRQQMARETINRQLEVFGTRFRNLRVSSVISALTTGGIAFDKDGNLLPPDSTHAPDQLRRGVLDQFRRAHRQHGQPERVRGRQPVDQLGVQRHQQPHAGHS